MTAGYVRYALCLLLLIALVSCAGAPATRGTVDTETLGNSVVQVDPLASNDAPDRSVDGITAVEPPTEIPESSALGEGNVNIPAGESPLVSETVPVIPPPERIITFYPEPEGLLILGSNDKKGENLPSSVKPEPVTPAPAQQKPAPAPVTPVTPPKPAPEAAKPDTSKSTPEPVRPSGGIWTAERETPATSLSLSTDPAPSRKASLARGETLEVRYPGTGWVYLGTADIGKSLRYESRFQDRDGTLFLFRSLAEGVFNLAFSRFDVLTDSFTQDTLEVTVTAPIEGLSSSSTVRSPEFRPVTPTSSIASSVSAGQTTTTPSFNEEPSIRLSSTQSPSLNTSAQSETNSDLLASVRSSLASGDVPAALRLLDSFTSLSSERPDEVLFLRAQAFETAGPARDVRRALETYETLLKEFPESTFWKEADVRSRYIRRFYLQIR